jgi:nicotinate-nucleotide adenylyltransferase
VAAVQRLDMVRLACADNPRFVVDDREVASNAPGYTVDTLTGLRRELGEAQALCLLLGADAFLGLTAWHRWQELFALAHVVVAQRPGFPHLQESDGLPDALHAELARRLVDRPGALQAQPAGRIFIQTITALDISASRIRGDLASGASPRYLMPDAVLDYIAQHHLYKD